ncbi:E3 ubiquitin-protein ligase TRIM7-like [Hemicordylus capensis]|uniref:E3 ubiquitin-protein ligase TRIM7-like n=1 Tax=Hemicordylus capensis TaxID=884348 RepID=UPI00230309A5|nr:E3 ubiquitin-protein ligase TRIM7-like [Hemicordylus capensis]
MKSWLAVRVATTALCSRPSSQARQLSLCQSGCLPSVQGESSAEGPGAKQAAGQLHGDRQRAEGARGGKRRGWRFCEGHQEPLKLFCKEDEAPICLVCGRSKERRAHDVVPVEEAALEYKGWVSSSLENVRKEKEKALQSKAERESLALLTKTRAEKEKTVAEFKKLHQFLKTQEKLLLAQIEELENQLERERAAHMDELPEELSSLERTIREMEEECQPPDVKSNLQSCEKEPSENPSTFSPALKWKMWECLDINPFLEGIMKQFKDALESGLQPQKDTCWRLVEDQIQSREGTCLKACLLAFYWSSGTTNESARGMGKKNEEGVPCQKHPGFLTLFLRTTLLDQPNVHIIRWWPGRCLYEVLRRGKKVTTQPCCLSPTYLY